jgi:glycosyltransferase involved in cell wall biosynthesis
MEGLFNKFMPHLSVVIPVYNESSLIDELVKRVKSNVKLITEDYEVIIVDDGSQDDTWSSIENEARSENRVKGIKFSRNFGHHYAITAGLHNSNGEWVVVMDGDLQDRPEVIPELYKKAQEGFAVVFVSRKNRPEKRMYLIVQKFFYKILRFFSGIDFDSEQANYSIISKHVVEAYKSFPEKVRFYPSTIMWLGFTRSKIYANHGKRLSGSPSYTLKKRIKLAIDIIVSFSEKPLNFIIGFGIVTFITSLTFATFLIFIRFFQTYIDVGYLVFIILFYLNLLLIFLIFLAIYIREILNIVKDRPMFVIEKLLNLDQGLN